jgi:hypothetical protein
MRKTLTVFVFLLSALQLFSQINPADSAIKCFIPNFSFSYQFPGGDIANEYGSNATIGGGFFVKGKKNFLFSADFNYMFGGTVKNEEEILSMVLTKSGHIIDGNGTYALYTVNERGFTLNARFGKIFSALGFNPNSGLMLMGGVGYLQYFTKIDNQFHTAPQISGDYAKGYDHLKGGVVLSEFIGYFFMSNSRILNFYAGFELMQGFTKSKRDYLFDMMGPDNNSYQDFFYGIRVGWMIPVFKRVPREYYYY